MIITGLSLAIASNPLYTNPINQKHPKITKSQKNPIKKKKGELNRFFHTKGKLQTNTYIKKIEIII